MKLLTLTSILLLSSSLTYANDTFLVNGGHGTDGATNEPMPRENSTEMAIEIYKSLKTKVKDGKKKVGITIDGEFFGLTCSKPKKGIYSTTSSCDISTLIRSEELNSGIYLDNSIKISGKIAERLYAALKVKPTARTGAMTKTAGNLSCQSVADADQTKTCRITGINMTAMSTDYLLEEGLPQEMLNNIIKKLKI